MWKKKDSPKKSKISKKLKAKYLYISKAKSLKKIS